MGPPSHGAFRRPKFKNYGLNKSGPEQLCHFYPTLPKMESKARDIFREALVIHYVDTLAAGDEVDAWLRKHGGWLPDPQELYGDGTPLTQPADEGLDVFSNSPEIALREAEETMDRLVQSLHHDGHHHTRMKALRWLD